jgi:hypothetical protein
MRCQFAIILSVTLFAVPAAAADDNCAAAGDLVLAARTPEVDLYDAAGGKRVQTLDAAKFPACTPIVGRAPNMMLQIAMNGQKYWIPPYMLKYRFSGKLPAVCRNLAMGSNTEKVGVTRGLGEGCPKAGGAK